MELTEDDDLSYNYMVSSFEICLKTDVHARVGFAEAQLERVRVLKECNGGIVNTKQGLLCEMC